jgi:predicted ATPase
MADDSLPQRTSSAPARATTTPGWRQFVRRRVLHRLADRRLRRRMVLVLVTVASIGMLAAAKGLIGYYVFQQKSTRFEVALLIVGLVAGAFAIGEKRLASALEARFTRNTRKHREGLAALADELATLTDRGELERRLVARFDALFATTGTVLYVGDGEHGFAVAAHSCAESPALLVPDDPLVVRLRDSHKPVAPQDVDSAVVAPLAWPLRARGRLIGVLAAGEHEYIETFDAREVEGVTALADAAAANLALLDPALVAHAPHGTPNNLPTEPGTFIGRERELGQCMALLAQARILTLTGFGGAGKSRLALRLAEESLATFPAGVWWIELAHIADDAHVAASVAAAVGVPETRGMTLTQQLVQRFGERAVLLVLDTCEHVRAGCRELVEGLVGGCRHLAVIATSQGPLGAAEEATFALGELALPDSDAADPAALAQSDAVRLFVERARRVVPDFAPDDADLAIVADVVRKLEGIPLAIELAAARLKVLSLPALRDHLAERLRLLTGGAASGARHATMRASLEWSFDHLAPGEQVLARRLSVFAGGFSLAAAARVANGDGDELALLDELTALADRSVIVIERERGREPRYRMLATMREFVQEMLAASGEADAVTLRHRDYFVALAQDEAPRLRMPDAPAALATLDHAFDNLMAAHAACLHAADGALPGMRLAQALSLYWLDRGLLARGDEVMQASLDHAGAQDASLPRAELLVTAARHALLCGNAALARTRLDEGLALARALDARALVCRAVALDGLVLQHLGDDAGARRMLDDAVAGARTLDDARVLRDALDEMADFHRARGALDDAAAAIEESLALARAGDDLPALHLALRDAARLAVERRRLDAAAGWLREALALALSTGARFDGENDLEVAGELAAARADWGRAARYDGAADAAAVAMGSARGVRDDAITRADNGAPRAALGDAAYASAYAGGQRLRLADALAEARDWLAGA